MLLLKLPWIIRIDVVVIFLIVVVVIIFVIVIVEKVCEQ